VVSGVASGKVGWHGSHRRGGSTAWGAEVVDRRCSEAAGDFWWSVTWATRSYSTIGPSGMRGGQRWRATMAGGGSSLKGATNGGGGGVPLMAGRGQEVGGEVALTSCLRRRKRGRERKGRVASVTPF
jgi:hypothetical protein